VLERFADIAREVEMMPLEELPQHELTAPTVWREEIDQANYSGRLRELEICSRRMRMIETLSVEELKGLGFLKKDLWHTVFGFKDHPHCAPAHDRPGGPGAEVWVFAHAAKLGAAPFWNAW